MIAAQQYYIDYGGDMVLERLQSLLPTSYIPDTRYADGVSIHFIHPDISIIVIILISIIAPVWL